MSAVPTFTAEHACRIARDVYALTGTADPLPSYADQNFRLRATGGQEFVLKIANADEDQAFLAAHNEAMAILEARGVAYCPRLIQTPSGEDFVKLQTDGFTYLGRLITWLPGEVLATCEQSPGLLRELGVCVGQLDAALTDFDHPALHRGSFAWDLQNAGAVIDANMSAVDDPQMRQHIERIRETFRTRVEPRLPELPQGVIHNDANDYNVLVSGQRIAGLIDFGDMVYSQLVSDLAIATAYAILDKPDPLCCAATIAAGYHSARPLSDAELSVLWPMACARLAVSACMAAVEQRKRPDDPYISINQQPIRRTLQQLLDISPYEAATAFGRACG